MLTSQARETLRNVQAVIIDEIHAVAATKRGTHLAVSLERLEDDHATARRSGSACPPPSGPSTRSPGSSAATGPTARRGRCRRRRRQHASRSSSRSSSRWRTWAICATPATEPAPDGGAGGGIQHLALGAPPPPRAGPAAPLHPDLHQRPAPGRTARHPAERAHLRGDEPRRRVRRHLATAPACELVKAHHGSLSREQRLVIEDELKAGRLRGLVATSRSSSASTWAPSTSSCRSSRPDRSRPACSASAAPATRWASRAGARSSPSTAATCSRPRSSAQRMRAGLIEETRYPRNPSTCWPSRSSPCAPSTTGSSTTCSPSSGAPAPFAELTDDGLRGGARPALRPLPERRVRRAAAPHRVGPAVRRAAAAAGAAPSARRHQRRHHPRPWPLRRVPARRQPGRRARRGDGLREPGRRDVPPRRLHLAHRGHHPDRVVVTPAPGSRARCRSGTATSPAARSSWAGRSAPSRGRSSSSSRLRRPPGRCPGAERLAAAADEHALDELAATEPASATSPSSGRPPASCPTTAPIVVERFRDEIGDWRVCVLSPFGARVHAPWAMALEARRWPSGSGSRGDHVERRRHRAAAARGRRRRPARRPAPRSRRRRRRSSSGTSRARRCSPPGSGRPRPGRCSCPAAGPTGARRCGSSASGPPTCCRSRRATPASRSCSRRHGSACSDVFDLPALREVLGRRCAAGAIRRRAGRHRPGLARSPSRCCSAGSPSTCTRATRRSPSDGPPPSRSTATCSRELLGAEELRELIDPGVLADLELELQRLGDDAVRRATPTRSTTCCAASATSPSTSWPRGR